MMNWRRSLQLLIDRCRSSIIRNCCWLLLLLPMSAVSAPITVIDDSGQRVELERPARRIITLAPHVSELIATLGSSDRLVATDSGSDYPHDLTALPRIGSANAIDLEAIVALQPDLILAWQSGNPPRQLAQLQRLGIAIYRSEPRQLEDIATNLERIGKLLGQASKATAVASTWRQRLAALRQPEQPINLFYQIWHRPTMTLGGGHFVSEAIHHCGGQNLFADLTPLAPVIDLEAVIRRNPDIIVASGSSDQPPPWLTEWQKWPQITAVAHGAIYTIHPDLLQRPGPRLLDGIAQLCHFIASTAAKEANPLGRSDGAR
jgi:iron complex transport system substrate-binding protein